MIFTHGRINSQIIHSGTDSYGRWSWMRLQGQLKTLTIISVCQVGDSQDHSSPDSNEHSTTFRKQLCVQGLKDKRTGTPRDQHLEDLTKLVDKHKWLGDSILVCGDFNEVFQLGATSHDLAETTGLIDIMARHLRTQDFNTHQRNNSNKRIDFALASPDICKTIDSAGHLPFGLHFKGDHRPFCSDLEINALLGDAISDVATPTKRGINSRDKKNRAKHIEEKCEELEFHNFFDRLSDLESSDCNPEVFE